MNSFGITSQLIFLFLFFFCSSRVTSFLLINPTTTAAYLKSTPSIPQNSHSLSYSNWNRHTKLRVVADSPILDDEKRKRGDQNSGNNENNDSDWIESDTGGFIPNLSSKIRSLGLRRRSRSTSASASNVSNVPSIDRTVSSRPLKQVLTIQEYKKEVADIQDRMVCVRFYAPWCKACKAVEGSFRRLSREFSDIKFIEVPVTKENAFLHQGLGIPSVPFGHLYDPSVGLVEERKLNKHVFEDFRQILQTYADGECPVTYSSDGSQNYL